MPPPPHPPPPPRARGADDEPLEGELARFFGYSHDVLSVLEGSGRVLMISPSVERVLGHPIEALLGKRLLHWVHPEDQERVRAKARALLAGTAVSDLDVRLIRIDGSWAPMRWSLSVGPGRCLYAVGRDRTAEALHRETLWRHQMAELRLRTAMELHDGVLQTLTGAGLQIAVARRLLRTDPTAADEVLEGLAETVAAEQREMRLYVDEVKGEAPEWADGVLDLTTRIDNLLRRVGMIWGVETSVESRMETRIAAELGRQVLRIVQESTVNAARHGGAQTVSVRLASEGSEIVITIVDDGHGFSFQGEYDDEALRRERVGPLSLKHRVEDVGGRIGINSTPDGSEITIRLSVEREDAP